MDPTETFGYAQTVVTAPTAPAAQPFDMKFNAPLIREIFAGRVIDEPRMQQEFTSAASFFTGNGIMQVGELLRYIKYGQKMVIPILKDQNPLSLYQREDLEYDEIDGCHEQLKLNCTMPCINTIPEIETVEIAFDHEYAWGVRACDKNKEFWDFEFFTRQYGLSKRGYEFGRELDMWNTVMASLIAAPATTVDIDIAQTHPTHFWSNLGSVAANARTEIMDAYQYLVNSYDGMNPTIFIAKELATELIESVENPYNLNLSQVLARTYDKWDVPGYEVSEGVKTILGAGTAPVVIMKRSPWMSGADFNKYPLWNEDRTKQYVAILDPRVGYDFEIDGYHLTIEPYDCDKLIRGMIDSVYVAMGTTFAQYGMVLEFDGPSHDTPTASAISFAAASGTVEKGSTEGFEATVTPAGAAVTFTSSDPAVATVAPSEEDPTVAIVTGVEAGVAAITATSGNKNATMVVTVTE